MLSSNMLTPRGLRASGQSTQRSNAFTAAHAAPQQQRVSTRTQALGVSITTQIVTTALIAGAWYLSQQQQDVEQERLEASDRPCPSCGGSGVTPCFCTKWSDGDVGCSSCSRSGWTKCKSCGGGGLAVPIKVSIRKNDVL